MATQGQDFLDSLGATAVEPVSVQDDDEFAQQRSPEQPADQFDIDKVHFTIPDPDNEPDTFRDNRPQPPTPLSDVDVSVGPGYATYEPIKGEREVSPGVFAEEVPYKATDLDGPMQYATQTLKDIALAIGAGVGNLIGNTYGFISEQLFPNENLDNIQQFFSDKENKRLHDRSRDIHDAIARGETFEGVYRTVSGAVGDVWGNLAAFKAAFKMVTGGELINRGAGWKSFAAQQAGRAAFGYAYAFAKTDGDVNERNKAGLLSMMYMATPIASSWSKTDLAAVGKDLILNSIITASYNPEDVRFEGLWSTDANGKWKPSGQYGQAWEEAEKDASDAGDDRLFWKFFTTRMIPLVGSDIGFSLLTRSAKSNYDKTQIAITQTRPPADKIPEQMKRVYADYEKAAISMGVDPAIVKNRPIGFYDHLFDGKVTPEELNRVYRSSSEFGQLKEQQNQKSPVELREMAEGARINQEAQRIDPETQRAIPQSEETAGVAGRVMTMADIPRAMSDVLGAMSSRDAATLALTEFAANPATAPHIKAMYDAKVASGEIIAETIAPRTEGERSGQGQFPEAQRLVIRRLTPSEMVSKLADAWKPSEEPWTPERIGALEEALPETARIQIAQDAEATRPYMAALSRNLQSVQNTIPLSATMQDKITNQSGATIGTRGERLNKGISIGLTKIAEDPTITPFNFVDKVNEMVRSEAKGGVPGFGTGARDAIIAAWRTDTPDEALRYLNNLRVSKGKPPIQDSAAASGMIRREPFRLSPEDREQAMIEMSRQIPDSIKSRILDNAMVPLPRDPELRASWINAANRMARQTAHADQRRDPNGVKVRQDSIAEKSRLFQSSRYFFMNIAQDTGDYRIYDRQQSIDVNTRRAVAESEERLATVLKVDAGSKPHFSAMRWISSNPDVEAAIVHKVGINPETKSAEHKEALARADQVISALNPKRKAQVERAIEGIRNELGGVSAINVRFLQLDAFEQAWRKPWGGKPSLGEAWADAQASGNKKLIDTVMSEVNKYLPMRHDEATGKGSYVPVEKMLELSNLKTTDGENNLRVALAMEDFGTRKYYWMSEPREYDPTVKATGISEMPSFELGTPRISGTKATGEIQTREGEVDFRQGSLFGNLYRHIHQLEVQAATITEVRELKAIAKQHLDNKTISDNTFRHMNEWVQGQWGKGQRPGVVSGTAIKANAAWWTLYFGSATRAAWYSARNVIGQGTPFGHILTQFRIGDISNSYGEAMRALRDPSSFSGRWMDNTFRQDISQKAVYLNEIMMMRDPSLRHYGAVSKFRAWGELKANAQRWASWVAGQSDDWNRMILGSMSFTVGEKYVSKYIAGDISYSKLEDALMLNTLQPVQRLELLGEFNRAVESGGDKEAFYPFLSRMAEFKNENMNYLYRISGKSIAEQNPNDRPWLGLLTYPRGQIEQTYQNGYKPMMEGLSGVALGMRDGKIDADSLRQMKNGIRTLVMQQAGLTAASIVGATLIGQKNEDEPMFGGPSSWTPSPFTPGTDMAISGIWGGGSELLSEILAGDVTENVPKMANTIAEGLFLVAPALHDMRKYAEATGNFQAKANIDYLLYITGNKDLGLYRDVERTTLQKLKHTLFGTVKEETDMDDKALRDLIIKNNMIINWFSDDEPQDYLPR